MKSLSIHCCVCKLGITFFIYDFCVDGVIRGEKTQYLKHNWHVFSYEMQHSRVVVVSELFAYPVHRFLHFKLASFVYQFITALSWKRWDTLGKMSSFQGI